MSFSIFLLDVSRSCEEHDARALPEELPEGGIDREPLHVVHEFKSISFVVTTGQVVFIDLWSGIGGEEWKGHSGLAQRISSVVPFGESLWENITIDG